MSLSQDIQGLYIAYFNRPADFLGLQFWEKAVTAANGDINGVASAFAASNEYKSMYEGKATAEIIDTIYLNLFGRHAEPDGITFWGNALDNNVLNIGNIAYQIMKGAQNDDKIAITSKIAAAEAFYGALDTSAEIVGYSGDAANAVARAWLSTVTNTANLDVATSEAGLATVTAAVVASSAPVVPAQTYTLAAGADNIAGTAGNDTINGTEETLSVFDEINGGAGTDTMKLVFAEAADAVASGSVVTGVENIVIKAAASVGTDDAAFDISEWTGVKTVDVSATGAEAAVSITSAASDSVSVTAKGVVTLADETAAAIAVNTAGDLSTVDITAGDAGVTVVTKGENADVTIAAAAAKAIAVTVTAQDDSKVASVVSITADSATSVSVAGSSDVTVAVDSLGSLTLAGLNTQGTSKVSDDTVVATAADVTVTDNTELALTLNAADVTLTLTDSNAGVSAKDADLTALNVTVVDAAKASTLSVVNGTDTEITDITISGAGDLALTVDTAVVTDIVATAATGDITVTLDGTVTNYTGGAGVDTVTLTALPEAEVVKSVPTGHFATVINGGAGSADVIAMAASLAGDAAGLTKGDAFTKGVTGFEILSLTDITGDTVDATTFGISHVVLASVGEDGDALGLTIANKGVVEFGANTAATVVVKGAADGAASAFSLDTVITGGVAGIDAGSISVDDIGSINLISNGTAHLVNKVSVIDAENTFAISADSATTLTITGTAALDLSGTNTFGKLSTVTAGSFDAGLKIDLSSVEAQSKSDVTGVAITTGKGDDVIVGSSLADTINAGAGDNTVTGGAGADQITVGTGENILVYTDAADSTGLNIDTVTGFNAADLDATSATSYNTFDLTGLVGALTDVVFLGSVANATLANTALLSTATTLQVIYVTGEHTLYADVNADGVISDGDLAIELVGLTGTLSANNFTTVA